MNRELTQLAAPIENSRSSLNPHGAAGGASPQSLPFFDTATIWKATNLWRNAKLRAQEMLEARNLARM
jgi:hypothetical protein